MVSITHDSDLVEFEKILANRNIRTLFQPIVSLKNGDILGYEALSRGPVGSIFESAPSLFQAGSKYGRSWELERVCRQRTIEKISKLSLSYKTFINVNPKVILEEGFKKGFTNRLLSEYGVDPSSIVFELTEGSSIKDFDLLKDAVTHYLKQGYKIAVDDLGEGYSGLKILAETHPDYMKIDMSLVRNIEKKPINQALLKAFCEFGKTMNIKVIAEGIETDDELRTLVEIGVDFGQGYLIGKPEGEFFSPSKDFLLKLDIHRKTSEKLKLKDLDNILVGEVARIDIPIDILTKSQQVFKIFTENKHLMGIPITDKSNSPIGLVMRDSFFGKLATQYGTAVYMRRPVSLLMKKNPVFIDYYTTVSEAAEIVLGRRDEDLYDYLVVTKNSKYFGVITIRDILERLLEREC